MDAFSYNVQQARKMENSKTSREEPKGEEKREVMRKSQITPALELSSSPPVQCSQPALRRDELTAMPSQTCTVHFCLALAMNHQLLFICRFINCLAVPFFCGASGYDPKLPEVAARRSSGTSCRKMSKNHLKPAPACHQRTVSLYQRGQVCPSQ